MDKAGLVDILPAFPADQSMTHALRIRPDKISSVCTPLRLGPYLTVSRDATAGTGTAIVCRVLTARQQYGYLELPSGRQAILVPGDVIVGVLGARAALRGFCGRPPEKVAVGDRLCLLNQGGVIGVSEGRTVGLGVPIELEVLGTPTREDQPLRLGDYALAPLPLPQQMPPVLAFAGTCMNAGKTTAAGVLIHYLRARGLTVHAGKATGVACIKDLLEFSDNGASKTLSFLDCGVPSTCYRDDVPNIARTLLANLAANAPDIIVLELGDGLLGSYGVDEILAAQDLAGCMTGAVLAANDIIGGYAAAERLRSVGITTQVITGPATDNIAGEAKLNQLGYGAANIFHDPARFCRLATPESLRSRVEMSSRDG
jgi:hypothetical protein